MSTSQQNMGLFYHRGYQAILSVGYSQGSAMKLHKMVETYKFNRILK